MDATQRRSWAVISVFRVASLAIVVTFATVASAADYRTQNFIIMAPTAELARTVGDAAESFRRDLAIYWLGGELPPWPTPCPVRVIAGQNLAAQGVTTYNRAPVRDFQMEVVGSPQRILDSVLPHEVTHTILATYFGRPLPRWADEGICTTVEHESERQKHEAKLREFLRSRRGIAMNKLFLMTEYPSDVLPLYAQGYSVCQFLIAQNGPRSFVQFLGDYMQSPSWTQAVRTHYGYESLAELQQAWLAWVSQGSGPVDAFVKNPTTSPVVPASLASATLPGGVAQQASATSPPASMITADDRLARATPPPAAEGGWYSRLRQETLASDSPGAKAPASWPASLGPQHPPLPPARTPQRHSVAQPQPEQGAVPGGAYLPGSLSAGATTWR